MLMYVLLCSYAAAAGVLVLLLLQSNARFMLLVDDLIRPESLPRGWTSEFKLKQNKW